MKKTLSVARCYKNKFMHQKLLICIILFGIFSLVPTIASSEELLAAESQLNAKAKSRKDAKFAIGIGLGTVRFDTKIKFTNKDTGNSVFIDPEGTLGLPVVARVDTFYGAFRAGKRHTIGFAYFSVNRETTLFDEKFNFEDLIVVSGSATLSDNTQFYFLDYGYSLYRDDRSNVNVLFGISGLDLKYTFVAEGEITLGNNTSVGSHQEEASIFAPLPLFGLDIAFDLTQKWTINTKAALVYGKYKDITAGAIQAGMNVRYWFNKHIGGVLGLTVFNSYVTQDEVSEKIEVNYGYGGAFAGLHIVF